MSFKFDKLNINFDIYLKTSPIIMELPDIDDLIIMFSLLVRAASTSHLLS